MRMCRCQFIALCLLLGACSWSANSVARASRADSFCEIGREKRCNRVRRRIGLSWRAYAAGCRCTVDTKPAGVVGLSHHFSSNAKSSEGLAGAYQKLVDGGKLQAGDLAQVIFLLRYGVFILR